MIIVGNERCLFECRECGEEKSIRDDRARFGEARAKCNSTFCQGVERDFVRVS